jgi:TRAP-type C4-dicarboxylate transport system permease large subunit
MLVIMIFFFAMGFFIDIIPMILIGVPVLYPIITAMGMDPYWFAVLLIMTIQTGVITPPFATILYALKGFLPHIEIDTIFKGVMPYVLATAVVLLILFLFPQLITVLAYA